MSESTRVIINGAAGRMGQALSKLIADRDNSVLVGALVRPGSALDTTPIGRASS